MVGQAKIFKFANQSKTDKGMNEKFEMVAKTFQGLEEVLAEELRSLGAENVEPGRRMVSFEGDKAMLYKANLCCRTALRILKPIYKFIAGNTDELYEMVKEFDWGKIISIDKTFAIDTVAYSDEFSHSRFVTYRVKDAIVDWFRDRYDDKRPGVRLQDADVLINVHIAGDRVTLSLDSSGESLHKRGYRVAQTEAPINEVLAAGIIMLSGWRGDCPLVDPMCGSGTFVIEGALIAANIMPGVFRKNFAFENWPDFDEELFESIYNDDSNEREVTCKICGADISPKAVDIALRNAKSAGVAKYIDLEVKPLSRWEDAPADGVIITNPPYGERISVDDMEGLYQMLGQKLKHVFQGYHAWIIGYKDEYFQKIHLAASVRIPLLNGSLECELREYVIFEGDMRSFRNEGGRIKHGDNEGGEERRQPKERRRPGDREWMKSAREKGFGGKDGRRRERSGDRDDRNEKPYRQSDRRRRSFDDRDERSYRQERGDRRDHRDRYPSTAGRRFERQDDGHDDNPLKERRNAAALRQITGKQPSLPAMEGPMMRLRRGWKKREEKSEEPSGNNE